MALALLRKALSELSDNESAEFFAVLKSKERRRTKADKPYFELEFGDRFRSYPSKVWSDSSFFDDCERGWEVGKHYRVQATLEYKTSFGHNLALQALAPVTADDLDLGYNPADVEAISRFSIDFMYGELVKHARDLKDAPLSQLVLYILETYKERICTHAAAEKNHHAFRGGYLEHTWSVTRNGKFLANRYATYYDELDPPLNQDLVVAGCILHDIGKVVELEMTPGGAHFTVPGTLIGHICIGRDIVREAARQVPDLDRELLLYLEHIILAHQGTAEWGSPKPPTIPEALIVHYADDLDAKMAMFVGAIMTNPEGDGTFTKFDYSLRRRLLRKRAM